ncbi:MAG: methionine--tRNA ligase subunit beta [Candidatus Saganbacteria bacterium]|nr:methionine--tRNA ligase subunit beta [Candidatus Saganbacteria bacterium]
MENIIFDDFKKLDLRVGEIKEVEDVEGADRIYKVKVDIGEERQLIAGIKQFYAKEELVGKKVVVICNLEPKTIRGVESHGMLFAASTPEKDQLTIVSLDKDIPNGSRVS